jgi:hypothetical protein
MPYTPPAPPSSGVDLNPLLGSLLLITVHDMKRNIQTVHGLSDAARVDLVVLDGEHKKTEHTDVLIFPRVMRGQLEKSVGQTILARLSQGNKKPGQNAPWLLIAGDEKDAETARKYEDWKRTQVPAPEPEEDPF